MLLHDFDNFFDIPISYIYIYITAVDPLNYYDHQGQVITDMRLTMALETGKIFARYIAKATDGY